MKHIKQLLCMLLTVTMVLGSFVGVVPASAASVEKTVYDQDFSDADLGYVGNVFGGWKVATAPETGTLTVADLGLDDGHGNVLQLTQPGGSEVDYKLIYALGGSYDNVELSFDIRFTEQSKYHFNGMYLNTAESGGYNAAVSVYGSQAFQVRGTDSLNISTEIPVVANTWHHVVMTYYAAEVEGTKTYFYDVKIDGVEAASQVKANKQAKVSHLDLEFSRHNKGTMYLDNVQVKDLAPVPIFSENFDTQTADAALSSLAGWEVTEIGAASAATVYTLDENEHKNVLKLEQNNSGASNLVAGFKFSEKYTNLELSFDLWMTEGTRFNDIGFGITDVNNVRGTLHVHPNGYFTEDLSAATIRKAYTPEKWYNVRIVYGLDPYTSTYSFDVYLDGELFLENRAPNAQTAIEYFIIMLSKWSSKACTAYLDNILVTKAAMICSETFENIAAGSGSNVLEGWTFARGAAKAGAATIVDLEDEDHGKVMKLFQNGVETASGNELKLQLDLPETYKELSVSCDLLFSADNIYLNGIYMRNSGNYSSSMGTSNRFFHVTEPGGGANVSTGVGVVANKWYNLRMDYYCEADADGKDQYYIDVYIDNTLVVEKRDARQDIPINNVFVEYSRGNKGYAYLDNMVVKAMGPEDVPESDGSDAVQFMGMDKTTGNQWIGVYGAKQAILPAKNVAEEPNFTKYDTSSGGVTFYRQVVKDGNDFYSDTSENAIKVSYNTGGGWWCLPAATHGLDLETPEGAGQYASLLNAYCMAGFTVGTDQQTTFKFTVPDGKTHQLTVFGSNPTKETGQVRFVFLDADGKQIGSKTLNYSDFDGGAYVSFLVEGGFTLRIDKVNAGGASKARYFGMGAFFFDEVPANFTSDLAAELGTEARSIDVTWEETNAPAGSKIMIFRKSASEGYAPIATVDAGVKTYHDTGLEAGQTYAYKLCCVSGNTYSAYSEEVACTVAAYSQGVLSLNSADYTVANSSENVTVLATVKDVDGKVYEGVDVSLTVSWDFDSTEKQIYNAQTNAEGVATITFQPEYMGEATLTVKSADHDGHKLSGDTETATLFVGQKSWTEAPVIYRISEGVAPGQTIGIYGYGMYESGSDTDVNVNNVTIYYAPHTAAAAPAQPGADAAELEVLQSDYENGTYLMAELPKTAQGGVYDIWVKNANGYSAPVVLNAARPLFISEYEAWAGQTIQVSGRNLEAAQFGASGSTQLRLVPVGGGEAVVQTLTKCTPYSMAFTVSGAVGEYFVEVTNDGMTWVRPNSGQTLTIVAQGKDYFDLGLAWMDSYQWDTVINVTDHGANGEDEASDKAAFQAAVAAAKEAGGGVVYIPNGTYYLDQLLIPSHVVLVGESMKKTVIVYNGDGSKVNFFQGDAATRNEGYLGFARFTVRLADETKRPDAFFWLGHIWEDSEHKYAYDQRIRTADNFFLYQIYLDSADTAPITNSRGLGIVAVGNERMAIQDCLFEGYGVGMGSNKVSRYVTLKDNEWYLEDGNVSISANYSFVEGNYVKGRYMELSDEEVTGDTHGLCFSAWCHLEDNFVEKMGSKVNLSAPSGEFNDGETYLPECQEHFETGFVVNATENSITVRAADGAFNEISASSRAWSRNRLCVVILAGRGAGQLKTIGSMNYQTGVITLAEGESWDVMPDSTSVFSINLPLECNTLYNNREATSSKGLYFYQDTVDCVIANHTCKDTLGISIFAPTVNANRVKMAHYITVRDCLVEGYSTRAQAGHISVNAGREYVNTYYGTNSFGVEIRDNTVLGTRGLVGRQSTEASPASGIVLRSGASHMPTDSEDGDITAVIVEGNTLSNLDAGVTYTVQDYGLLLKDNTFYNCGETTKQWMAYQDDDAVIKHMLEINSTVKDSALVASVEGKGMYTSLTEALKAAEAGKTVKLLVDLKVDSLVIPAGKILDLNGYELTADYVVAFSGAQLLDNFGGGLLKCVRVRLEADNEQLPVWDDAVSGYRFFTVLDQRKFASQDADKFVFYAKPALGTEANNGLMAKIDSNQLSFKIRMRWSDSGNEVEQLFSVKKETVASTYSQSGQVITLTVSGAGPYAGKLLVDVYLESETGVVWAGKALTYNGQ